MAYTNRSRARPRNRKNPRPGEFTAQEDAVLQRHYPRGGTAACQPKLPGRTRNAIRKRAKKLGISAPKPPRISESGLDIIKRWVEGDKTFASLSAIAEHLDVSHTAVGKRAKALGYEPRRRRKSASD